MKPVLILIYSHTYVYCINHHDVAMLFVIHKSIRGFLLELNRDGVALMRLFLRQQLCRLFWMEGVSSFSTRSGMFLDTGMALRSNSFDIRTYCVNDETMNNLQYNTVSHLILHTNLSRVF